MTRHDPSTLRGPLERWAAVEMHFSSPSAFPDIGISLLEAGYDTPDVVRLAVSEKDDHPADLRKLASRAFRSIGVTTEDEHLHEIVIGREIADRIVSGRVSYEDGLAEMVRMWVITGHSELFKDWMYLQGAITLFRDGYGGLEPFLNLSEDSIPCTIHQLAQQFLDSHALPLSPI